MIETSRQSSIVSYAGLSKPELLTLAKQAFSQADFDVPFRFASFLPLFPFELIQNMNYVGTSDGPAARATPLGFSRDPQEYHAKLYRQLPDLYQGDNYRRNFDYEGHFLGRSVFTVDSAWVSRFPQFAPFLGEKLVLHFIGGGHQAVALPESIFPRGGGLLCAVEKAMQITQRAEQFALYAKSRISSGDVYDAEVFGHDYLELTGLSPVMLRQSELGRILQDLSIARSLQGDAPAAGLFTESAKRVEHLHQYVPFLYACDTFEFSPVTKHTARLFQPYFVDSDFISDLWIPYQDIGGYIDRDTMTIDMQRLCQGYQIAPLYDPVTGGGRYPDALRVIVVRDREISLMVGDVLGNPAYGSGMNPLGMIGRQVFLPDSQELIRQRKLAPEEIDFAAASTTLPREEYIRALLLSALQEYKGNLVDAMYRREAALSQIAEDSRSYEKAKATLDEKVSKQEKQVAQASAGWRHSQVSGYDADIDYLRRKQWNREGLSQEDQREPIVFSLDLQREQSIESGYAMRNNLQRFSYQQVHVSVEAAVKAEEEPIAAAKPAPVAGAEPSPGRSSQSEDALQEPANAPGAVPAADEAVNEEVRAATDKAADAAVDASDHGTADTATAALPNSAGAPSDPASAPPPEPSPAPLPTPKAPAQPPPAPRAPASFSDLTRKLVITDDPSAPKLAYIVRRDSEPKIHVDNKDGKMASLASQKPKDKKP